MLRIMIASVLLFFCHFAHSSHTPQLDLFGPGKALGYVARYCDDPFTLQSLSSINRDSAQELHDLYMIRCAELKSYITNPKNCINPTLVTCAPNNLRVYFTETIKSPNKKGDSSFLVNISHYGDDYKKKIMNEFHNESFYKNKLSRRIKPFIIRDNNQNVVCMYEYYTTEKDSAGELIQIYGNGRDVYTGKTYLYFQLDNLLIPSSWLAKLLPKLHDDVINSGTARYVPWYACNDKNQLKEIRKEHTYKNTSIYGISQKEYLGDGIVIFDIDSFTGITDLDRLTLFKEHEGAGKDDFTSIAFILQPTEAMHMHFSWGHKKAVMENLPSIKPVEHKIPSYGVFTVDAFDEEICFIPSGGIMKKVRVLHNADQTYAHAFDDLKKQNVFVKKDWSVHAKALSQTLKDFAAKRYFCEHNENYLLVKDIVQSAVYVITLAYDGKNQKPKLEIKPSANLASCYLTKNGYECERFVTKDAAPKE